MRQRNSGRSPASRARRRRRLLIENQSAAYVYADFTAFKRADLDVSYCSGPGRGEQCPLTAEGGHCELAEAADIVLFGLDLDETRHREVLDAHHRHRPGRPVVVEAPRGSPVPNAPGCRMLPWPATVGEQLRVLEEELGRAVGGTGRPEASAEAPS